MRELSVQLYTVREAFAADPEGTLGRIAALGFRQLEPYDLAGLGDTLAAAVAGHDLRVPTAHASLLGADVAAVCAMAQRLGVELVIDPFTPRERWTSAEQVRAIAAEFVPVVAAASEHGLRVGYHNHEHELVNRIDGMSALEYFAEHAPADLVFEVDTYWAEAGGEPAVALLHRLGERVAAIHVKDGPATLDPTAQVAVGSGTLPIAAIVAAAPDALPVVELDATRGDLFEALAHSRRYLLTL